jgi:SAM-dependent methyltransferase
VRKGTQLTTETPAAIAPFVCPSCHGQLGWQEEAPACSFCDVRYAMAGAVPVLFPPEMAGGVVDAAPPSALDRLPAALRPLAQRLRAAIQPRFVYKSPAAGRLMSEFVASFPSDARIANVGAGATDYGPNVTNLDVFPAPSVHALATAERLPLGDACWDGVLMDAVLEHVKDDTATLQEIRRVLVPGGRALIDVPFVQPYHASPGDYRRFTEQGLRNKLEQCGFEVEATGVSVGPASAVSWIFSHFLAMLVSGRSDTVYRAARVLLDPLVSLLRFADRWLDRHPRATVIASGVWAHARKPD